MSILHKDVFAELHSRYLNVFGLNLEEVTVSGQICRGAGDDLLRNSNLLARTRSEGIREAVRWGEAAVFFIAPGIMSWVVPVMASDGSILGGLLGGEVYPEGIEVDRSAAFYHLRQSGRSASDINLFLDGLTAFHQERIRESCEFLRDGLKSIDESFVISLDKKREDAQQQREIAEIIHEKKARSSRYMLDQERILLSLIRIGDKNAARGVLNDMLASSFLVSGKLAIIKARMIETFGLLVRSAIEDSPVLERLLEHQQYWLNSVIEAEEFSDLCRVIRESLDDFMEQIFLQGFNRTNAHVSLALRYLSRNYRDKLSLQDVADHAGISKYRIAHLVKEVTGQSVMQHVKRMRVEKAQHLLSSTDKSYTEITYELGFTDQSGFIKQFRELTGTTPAKYRHRS